MIKQGFHKLLSQTSTLWPVVDDRIFFNVRPQSERRPSIVLTRVGTQLFRTFKSVSGSIKGSLQIDCLAPTYGEAKELARVVRRALDGYTGTVARNRFRWVQIDDESDIPTAPLEGRAEPTFGVTLDVRFMADEAT